MIDFTQLTKLAETIPVLTRLAESVRPAEVATIRRRPGDTTGIDPYREVTISFPNEAAARAFLAALEQAGKRLT